MNANQDFLLWKYSNNQRFFRLRVIQKLEISLKAAQNRDGLKYI
jgi:hypothetical protein